MSVVTSHSSDVTFSVCFVYPASSNTSFLNMNGVPLFRGISVPLCQQFLTIWFLGRQTQCVCHWSFWWRGPSLLLDDASLLQSDFCFSSGMGGLMRLLQVQFSSNWKPQLHQKVLVVFYYERAKDFLLSKLLHDGEGFLQGDFMFMCYSFCVFFASFHPSASYFKICTCLIGFSGGSADKESACNPGDLGSIPGLGRYPGEGKGYPLQYSGLKNSMDCIVHGVTKSWTQLSNFHFISLTDTSQLKLAV